MKNVLFEADAFTKNFLSINKCKNLLLVDEILNSQNVSEFQDSEVVSILASKIDKPILDFLPNLKYIITRSTGLDHIDLQECKNKNVQVLNITDYSTQSVAEFTFTLIYLIAKKIKLTPSENSHDKLRGIDIYGKTIGVIGTGSIGCRVIEMSRSLGLNVLVYTKYPEIFKNDYPDIKIIEFDELISVSDIITIHIPASTSNYHLLDTNLKDCKKDCILINTSRGSIVNTHELIKLLDKKWFYGVGLDDLEKDLDVISTKKLKTYKNVIITPHIAYNTIESKRRNLAKFVNIYNDLIKQDGSKY